MRRTLFALLVSLFASGHSSSEFSRGVVNHPTLTSNSFFAGAWIDDRNIATTLSDGDLWPSCWAGDDHLYSANGDGRGFNFFSFSYSDIVVNRISGVPPHLSGQAIVSGDRVGQIWNTNGQYNRKPTSMLCIDNTLYLAIQDLNLDFNDAPAASISRSTDLGRTWTWDSRAPMFDDYQFTTLMFLDYGRNSENAIDDYVYVYGLDYNWRESVTRRVPDPLGLYLARVPKDSIQTRERWAFYSGVDGENRPTWSPDIEQRVPVLSFDRAGYLENSPLHFVNLPALSQGSIVYNKPLQRYIYASWTQYTFEFYEAPQPWGPWTHFLTKSFGLYPWTNRQHGGYATTIPSKFISEDGRLMWVQSNVCPCGNAGMSDYQFSLRRLYVEPKVAP